MTINSQKNPMLRVASNRSFRLLFAGATTSLLGDQFALIATPWLVLQLTGDPLALGVVLALEGIPRAVFMLVGGAVTDRISPRRIMIIADVIRLILTGLMAFAVFTGIVQTWMLYAFGLGFGLVAGFAIPAENSIVPLLVEDQELQAGNSLMMGVAQLTGFVGPTIAGILIGGYASSSMGIALAFAMDALSFAVSAVCIWLIQKMKTRLADSGSAGKESIWASILTGLKHLWADQGLRLLFILLLAVNFLLVGPLLVGIPVLADQRLPEGAVAFGLLMSAYAGGNLAGYLLAGALPRPGSLVLRIILISLVTGFGVSLGVIGVSSSTWLDFTLLVLTGMGNGYTSILLFTWIQLRTPPEMLGRIMSIIIFCSQGLVPVSQALSGAISKWDLTALFAGAGALTVLTAIWMANQPGLKVFSDSLSGNQPVMAGGESPASPTG